MLLSFIPPGFVEFFLLLVWSKAFFFKYFQLSNSTNNPSFCPNRWADGSANMQTTSRWHSKCKSWWWKRPSWGSEQRGTIHKGLFQTKLPCSKLTWQQKVDLLSYWTWGISNFHVASPKDRFLPWSNPTKRLYSHLFKKKWWPRCVRNQISGVERFR